MPDPIIPAGYTGLANVTTSSGVKLLAEIIDGKLVRNVAVYLIPGEEVDALLEKYVTIVRKGEAGPDGRPA